MKSLALAFILVLPGALSAQTALATFIDWGRVSSSIYADQVFGVQLWVGTNFRSGTGDQRYLTAGFAPDSVFAWADGAALIIDPRTLPRDPAIVLATAPLPMLYGGTLRLLRRAAGAGWEDRVVLSLERGDSTPPVNIAARPEEARSFLRAMYQRATESSLAADWESVARNRYRTNCATDSLVTMPTPLTRGPMTYPAMAPAAGRVLLEFVIRADGSVDRGSILARATTDQVFVESAQRLVAETRFRPATCQGAPIAIVVQQSVNYVR